MGNDKSVRVDGDAVDAFMNPLMACQPWLVCIQPVRPKESGLTEATSTSAPQISITFETVWRIPSRSLTNRSSCLQVSRARLVEAVSSGSRSNMSSSEGVRPFAHAVSVSSCCMAMVLAASGACSGV